MGKKVNAHLLNARKQDQEVMFKEARWLESLEAKGTSPEELTTKVRTFLEFDEDESLIANGEDRMIQYNTINRSLVDINSLIEKLEKVHIFTDSEIDILRDMEDRIAEKVKTIYNIDDEDLYE